MNPLDILNTILLPLKLAIPQPVIARIPGLTTNEEIRIRRVLSHVGGRCLDIGCGENRLIAEYKSVGGEGIGVDVYPWDNVDVLVDDSSKLPFPDQTFDTITFIACLNHIPHRLEVLTEARRVLKDDGALMITFLSPAISAIWHRICFWDKDQKMRGMGDGEVYGFTSRRISSLLRTAGYCVDRRTRFSWGLNNLYLCSKTQVE